MDENRYKEEQTGEIEALNSIYAEEIESDEPHCFIIPVKCTEEIDQNEELSVEACVQFTFTECYPDEIPSMEVSRSSNMTEKDEQELITVLEEEAKNNTGMAMTFTLVSIIEEHLTKIIERIKLEKEEVKRKIELEIQKEEEKKYHGTQVTVESFTKWRIQFESELNEKLGKKKEETEPKKLTGRQLFQTDSSLQFSDIQFYNEGAGGVQVDESLFQELDDLELDEDD
eukprot:gene17498-9116_t